MQLIVELNPSKEGDASNLDETSNKIYCAICNNELVNDEEIYCSKCSGSTKDLISPTDNILEGEEKLLEEGGQ